jgi:hypothetical protein
LAQARLVATGNEGIPLETIKIRDKMRFQHVQMESADHNGGHALAKKRARCQHV